MGFPFHVRNVTAISRKDLKGYFDGPTAYIVIVVFLLLWEFLFFRSVFLVGEVSLRLLFGSLPWLFLLLMPAMTMGSLSQEKSEGTLEFLLTRPLRDGELLAGKFLAAVAFAGLALLFIFPVAASLDLFGDLDWGVVFGQYLAGFLLAAVFSALGIFASGFFASPIPALLVSAAAGFFLIIAGLEIVTVSLPLFLAPFFERLSALSHFESMSRGVIDLRDLWYFLSAILVFLSLASLHLLKRKFGAGKGRYRGARLGVVLFIGAVVLSNLIGVRIPGRVDLTEDRLYTLTPATKKILSDLKEVVTVTLFASRELPAQFQPVLRDTKDILRDYRTFGGGNVVIVMKDPGDSPQTAQEAASLGVREAQFNVVSQEEFQLKNGYLGIAVSCAGKSEAIPFIPDTKDLEYQLTGFIRQLTATEKKKIGFLSGHGEKNLFTDYQAFSRELQKQFVAETVAVDPRKPSIPGDLAALVVAGPREEIDAKTRSAITAYLERGGSGLFLLDGVAVDTTIASVTPNQNSFSDFLENYGVKVEPDIVYDLRSHATVNFEGGVVNLLLPYPFWARAVAFKASPVMARLESVVLPWASSVALDEEILKEKGLTPSTLLSTTRFGGRQTENFSIGPQQRPSQENLGEQVVAVGLSWGEAGSPQKGTRMVVIGDSDFLTDPFVKNSPENLAFGMEAVSWLSQQESLAGIQTKQKRQRKLLFENKTQMSLVKYGNMLLAILLPAGLGAYRLIRRRHLGRLAYSSD